MYSRDYKEYLKSPAWFYKKADFFQYLEKNGKKHVCQKCGGSSFLEVHHLTYKRLFHEDVTKDLELLCMRCHKALKDSLLKRFLDWLFVGVKSIIERG